MNRASCVLPLPRATVFIALFVILQVIASLCGNMFSTGSAVDLLPGVAGMTCVFSFYIAVWRLSPIWAKRSLKGC